MNNQPKRSHTGRLAAFRDALDRLPKQIEQQSADWLRAAHMDSIPFGMAQQHADRLSAEAELARVIDVLSGPQLRKWRLRLKGKGVDIDSLSPAALLVAIFKEVDEVVNDAN